MSDSPLAYFRGRFGRIELMQDAEAYRQLRELILSRQVSADERLDLEREVIIRHTAHAKQTQQRGIERAGGQL